MIQFKAALFIAQAAPAAELPTTMTGAGWAIMISSISLSRVRSVAAFVATTVCLESSVLTKNRSSNGPATPDKVFSQGEIDAIKRQQELMLKQREDLYRILEGLADQLASELKTAQAMPEMAHFFGDFASTIKKRQEQLRVQLKKLEVELEKITVQIFDRFSEMKKYELALENWKKRRAAEMTRREQQAMDEVAIRGYVRKDAT